MWKSILSILLSTITFGACTNNQAGNRNVITEVRTVPSFSTLSLDGIGTVRIHQGPQEVRVTIDENLLEYYETKVVNDNLTIGFKFSPSILKASKKVKTCEVDVTVPDLKEIQLNGAGKIIADAFSYEAFRISTTGAGVVEVKGAASVLDIKCTGAGKILARDLVARSGSVSLSGAGDVQMQVEDNLEASVSGAGKVLYWGNPDLTKSITGAGTIKKADEPKDA